MSTIDISKSLPNGVDRLQWLPVYAEVVQEVRVSVFWWGIFRAPSESPAKSLWYYISNVPKDGEVGRLKKKGRGGLAGEARGVSWGKGREKSRDGRERKWEEETVTLGLPHLGAYHRLAGRKLLYQPPKGESDFLKHFNKLGERDCPDITTVSVLIRQRALSEPAIPEPSTFLSIHNTVTLPGKAHVGTVFNIWGNYTMPTWLKVLNTWNTGSGVDRVIDA